MCVCVYYCVNFHKILQEFSSGKIWHLFKIDVQNKKNHKIFLQVLCPTPLLLSLRVWAVVIIFGAGLNCFDEVFDVEFYIFLKNKN